MDSVGEARPGGARRGAGRWLWPDRQPAGRAPDTRGHQPIRKETVSYAECPTPIRRINATIRSQNGGGTGTRTPGSLAAPAVFKTASMSSGAHRPAPASAGYEIKSGSAQLTHSGSLPFIWHHWHQKCTSLSPSETFTARRPLGLKNPVSSVRSCPSAPHFDLRLPHLTLLMMRIGHQCGPFRYPRAAGAMDRALGTAVARSWYGAPRRLAVRDVCQAAPVFCTPWPG
jgi:hypothetical protein